MRSRLPYLQSPVGNRVWHRSVSNDAKVLGLNAKTGWRSYWYSSGTSALAAAILAAHACKPSAMPKVAVTAYGCPDLVSAIHFAGAEPLFVDVDENGLGFDVVQLENTLGRTDNVIAIAGVDLFGVAERWIELRRLATSSEALLIQDCAQSVQRQSEWQQGIHGDLAVYSFGRGKPVYLQGGGALLANDNLDAKVLQQLSDQYATFSEAKQWYSTVSAISYNLVLEPHLYAILAMILGDRLGATRYEPLETIKRAPRSFARLANIAIEQFWQQHDDQAGAVRKVVAELVRAYPDLLDTPIDVENDYSLLPNLSRFPVLVNSQSVRDQWMQKLIAEGIGATTMYQRTLPEILTMQQQQDWFEYPNATRLAQRLLTLPVHNRLNRNDICAIRATFETCENLRQDES